MIGPSNRAATLRDVALAAKVAISTASRALAGGGLTSRATEQRVQRIAAELGYRPNTLARSLKTRSSRMIGLVVHNLTNASFRTLAEVAQQRLRAEGYQVLLCITADDAAQEAETINTLMDQRVDGLIICPTGDNGALLGELDRSGTPVIGVIRRDEAAALETVLAADPEGAFAGTRHLLALGHRRIGLIVGRQETTSGRERLAGYRRALQEAGIAFDPALIHSGRYEPETGLAGCASLLDMAEPPTALFVANHESSLGVLRGLAERNLMVPDDISLLCYEDVPGFEWQRPAISVVDSGAQPMAELATDRLLQRLRGSVSTSNEYRIGAKLIERQSCRKVAEV